MAFDPALVLKNASRYDESQTKQFLILPILHELGWDVFDPNEVWPEYKAGAYKFDYALKTEHKVQVIVEAKRLGSELSAHKKQLLKYSFEDGAPLAVLTDGKVWWVYMPRADGDWEHRFVESFSVTSKAVIQKMQALLSKTAVLSGDAVRNASQTRVTKESRTKVRFGLTQAISKLPENASVFEQVTQAVAKTMHASPDDVAHELAQFFKSVVSLIPTEAGKIRKVAEKATQLESVVVTVNGKTFELSEKSVASVIAGILLSIAVLFPKSYIANKKLNTLLNKYYKKGSLTVGEALKDWRIRSFRSVKSPDMMLRHAPRVRYASETLTKLVRDLEQFDS